MLGISAVERETGLSKDILRVWERRYGFPNPARDLNDERVYPEIQVEKLRVIRKLLDRGKRPRAIVNASMEELVAALCDANGDDGQHQYASQDIQTAIAAIVSNKPFGLYKHLKLVLARLGTKQFITEFATPLCAAVGSAWAAHRITINQEHFCSEQLQLVLYEVIAGIPQNEVQRPRILLATLTNEKHNLGLLMVQAYMSVEGAHCISLGTETPSQELCNAAEAIAADVVGVSFSSATPSRTAGKMLVDLRQMLEPAVTLWAGGSGLRDGDLEIEGCAMFASLGEVDSALKSWRQQH